MKKKILAIITLLMAMAITMSMTAVAGQWQQDNTGWWYQNDNGSWPMSGWEWIDGNNDGIAECYYFDESGYMWANTTTPDGFTVNADGAWIVDGVVQTRNSRVEMASYECQLWLMGSDWQVFDPPSDHYTAQILGDSEFFTFYDSTGTTIYTRGNKPEWEDYAEVTYDVCIVTGEIFTTAEGVRALKVFDLQVK